MAANQRETAVRIVVVDKLRLAGVLLTNLEKHKREFQEAYAGYREARRHAHAELSTAAALAASEDSHAARERASEAWEHLRDLDAPTDHSESYNQAIALMDWENRETVELSINDFECYVRDRWYWNREFEGNYASYRP